MGPLSRIQELPRICVHLRGSTRMQFLQGSSRRHNKGMFVWCERGQRMSSRYARLRGDIFCLFHVQARSVRHAHCFLWPHSEHLIMIMCSGSWEYFCIETTQ